MAFPDQITSMEPLLPQKGMGELHEKAAELMKKASALNALTHPKTAGSIKDLLRAMNSYYSNLIEGQSTHPAAIEAALKADYETDPEKRDLQKLAVAHIETQKAAEEKLINDPKTDITNIDFLKFLHREFYSKLPDVFLKIEGGRTLLPGELRTEEVTVGSHLPPLSAELPRFLERFNQVYSDPLLDPLTRIVAVAASHHRLAWIHPFMDGNGRVMRLFSDCFFMKENLGGFGLWTISRGLARKRGDYYAALASADNSRRNDYDGRGALSDECLSNFCSFFLDTALDQVNFMTQMLNLDFFEKRLERFIGIIADLDNQMKPESWFLLRDLFLRGEIPRGEAPRIMGLNERTARDAVGHLVSMDIVRSESPKSPLYLHFNPVFAYYMFPSLYPEYLDFSKFISKTNS